MNNEDLNIICHDESAQTWDALDLTLMRIGEKYTDCIIDYSNYERYKDTDICNLTEKIENDWENVKKTIEEVIKNNDYEYAFKMKGFCMIVEKGYYKGDINE